MDINKADWMVCKICGFDIKKDSYKRNGIYNTQKFIEHLNVHNLKIDDYLVDICKYERPICPCNTCGQNCRIGKKYGSNFVWTKYVCGRNAGVVEWSKKAKTERCGNNNPMYGKSAWNKGKNKDNCEQMKRLSELQTGRTISNESKEKMSQSAKKRLIHGHTGHKHTDESLDKMRIATLNRIKNGAFKQTDTLPHRLFRDLLIKNKILFLEEYILGHFSFDFLIMDYGLLVEIDGDYFHSNPILYPDGPKTKTQKINYTRDISKNNYCLHNNYKLTRIWENEVLNLKEDEILCKLRK